MNGDFLVGALVGLFIGGLIGTLAMGLAAVGSGQTWPSSSMRVDLLVDLRDVPRHAGRPSADVHNVEQEMRELVKRYGSPSES